MNGRLPHSLFSRLHAPYKQCELVRTEVQRVKLVMSVLRFRARPRQTPITLSEVKETAQVGIVTRQGNIQLEQAIEVLDKIIRTSRRIATEG